MLTVWNAFNDLFADDFWPSSSPSRREYLPAVDVSEDDGGYLVSVDVPGMKPEDVTVTVENNVLTVSGERRFENRSEKHGYHRVERRYGSFKRAFTLPEGVDIDHIDASVENGTLTVRIPKPEAAQPKRIKVSGGGLAQKAKELFSKPNKEPEAAATAS